MKNLILISMLFLASVLEALPATVQLAWTPGQGASPSETYNVYRGLKADGSDFQRINSQPITAHNYADTTIQEGVIYFYAARAVVNNQIETQNSNIISLDATVFPKLPQNLTIPLVIVPGN